MEEAGAGECRCGSPRHQPGLEPADPAPASGTIAPDEDVVAILTGHLLKDPDYVYHYHTGKLTAPGGELLQSTFGNAPVVMPNDDRKIAEYLSNAGG